MTEGGNQAEHHEREKKQQHQEQGREDPYSCLRILCLHDGKSNANEAHRLLVELDDRLYEKHHIETVYIDSPLIFLSKEQAERVVGQAEPKEPRRVWWEHGGEEQPFLGMDASLLHIRQIWKSMPFCGVIGIGQGASISTLLPMLLPQMEFGVFVHGKAILEEDEALMANWPCLHIVQESEIGNKQVQRMGKQFPGQVHLSKNILNKSDYNAIGKFLVKQKNNLRVNGGGEEIALQTQLHLVEHQAARIMAQHIAEDPPKALMAVVTPQAVGGWSGRRRREFGAEGGGAPCPSEFLMQRDKRPHDTNGPSRHHPKASRKGKEEEHIDEDDNDEENNQEGSVGNSNVVEKPS